MAVNRGGKMFKWQGLAVGSFLALCLCMPLTVQAAEEPEEIKNYLNEQGFVYDEEQKQFRPIGYK